MRQKFQAKELEHADLFNVSFEGTIATREAVGHRYKVSY